MIHVSSVILFGWGHCLAFTEFWSMFAWHHEWTGDLFTGLDSKMIQWGFGVAMMGSLTAACLGMAGFSEAARLHQMKTSGQRIAKSLLWLGGIAFVAVFNHFLILALTCFAAVIIITAVCAFAVVVMVATVRLAGAQHMVAVTVGIMAGDLISWWIVSFATDVPSLLSAIAVGTLAGWVTGELTHRVGQIFIRKGWEIVLP